MRRARFAFEPLTDWPYTEQPRVASPFTAKWTDTRDMLLAEADQLGTQLVVVELDITRADLRQDGEIRAGARLGSGRVRVTMDTRHGALRYAVDRYLGRGGHQAWQANLRAVALTLQALRAVDRYGAVHDAEQYKGFLAIAATAADPFTDADTAERWLRARMNAPTEQWPDLARLVRTAKRDWHPDRSGRRDDWDLLERAVEHMTAGGLV